jgi:hypothetical protein
MLRRSKIFIVTAKKNCDKLHQRSIDHANTYTQIYTHIVFAVQGRQNLIRREHNEEKYITGIISGQGQKLIAIKRDSGLLVVTSRYCSSITAVQITVSWTG